ncbi:MAG: hypothetical protein MUC53_12165 [Candidatus Contendobacter sp.]|jgi:hypothetical protein|nr:hypothetical protein [Candidatus Contendobacter sp.]
MKTNPVIVKSTVSTKQSIGRAERDLIRRHQAAMKQIDRWDVARELRPHTPRLAAEAARSACDWDSPVIQAMARQAEPLTGPRTGTHPMAERVEPRPMATRLRPALKDPRPLPAYRRELLFGAVNLALICTGVAVAWFLSR